jgi:hypothetical protein
MAKSATERKREQREREKNAQKAAPDMATDFLRTPFFEAEAGRLSDLNIYFDLMGMEMPSIDDDSAPRSLNGIFEEDTARDPDHFEDVYGAFPKNSLGKAESWVANMLNIVIELTDTINRYKLDEIEARIAEIEAADLSDPAVKAKALADIVTLREIKARLDGKRFRRSFPEINVKGSSST